MRTARSLASPHSRSSSIRRPPPLSCSSLALPPPPCRPSVRVSVSVCLYVCVCDTVLVARAVLRPLLFSSCRVTVFSRLPSSSLVPPSPSPCPLVGSSCPSNRKCVRVPVRVHASLPPSRRRNSCFPYLRPPPSSECRRADFLFACFTSPLSRTRRACRCECVCCSVAALDVNTHTPSLPSSSLRRRTCFRFSSLCLCLPPLVAVKSDPLHRAVTAAPLPLPPSPPPSSSSTQTAEGVRHCTVHPAPSISTRSSLSLFPLLVKSRAKSKAVSASSPSPHAISSRACERRRGRQGATSTWVNARASPSVAKSCTVALHLSGSYVRVCLCVCVQVRACVCVCKCASTHSFLSLIEFVSVLDAFFSLCWTP